PGTPPSLALQPAPDALSSRPPGRSSWVVRRRHGGAPLGACRQRNGWAHPPTPRPRKRKRTRAPGALSDLVRPRHSPSLAPDDWVTLAHSLLSARMAEPTGKR